MPGISAMYSTSVARSATSVLAHLRTRTHPSAIRVDVLPEQRDFRHALVGQVGNFGQHVVERAGDFLAARVRDHAERAVLAAAFHDRHVRGRAVDRRRRQMVELLDVGKRDVDLRATGRAAVADQLRQPVQGLRAEHDVDVRRALHDGGAFLARHAAADADDEIRFQRLQRAHATQIVEHPLLRAFAHRARVEQDDVGVFGAVGEREPVGGGEHVGHLVRVVLVHLAAERADVELLRHGMGPVAGGYPVGARVGQGRGL